MGGYFIGPEELELQHVAMTSDLLWQIPGFRVLGNGYEAVVVSSRTGSLRPCRADVVINGAHNQPINDVNPAEVGAIAAYSEGHMVGAPPEFYGSSGCGLIIIWTKR